MGGQLSAPSAACASGKRHVWLQVQDLESRNGACLPMACKAERWLSRSWLRPAGFGLGGRHHRSLANKRLPWSTFKVRSRRAPCSGSRQCPVLGQTFVADYRCPRTVLAKRERPLGLVRMARNGLRPRLPLIFARAAGASEWNPRLALPKRAVASNTDAPDSSLRSEQAASKRSGACCDAIWASPAGRCGDHA